MRRRPPFWAVWKLEPVRVSNKEESMMETATTITTPSAETTAATARSFAQQTPAEQVFSLAVFGVGALVSGAFLYYLVTDPARLTDVWTWTRSLPLLVQGVIWLLFLPWMLCLWMWMLPWAMPIRLVLVIAALGWTSWLLFPWK